MSETPVFSQRGGVWLKSQGGGFATWPFARLDVFPDRLEITHARYPREQIMSLRRRRFLLGSGLEVMHSKYNTPQVVIFWSLDFGALQLALQQCGYEVEV